MSSPRLPRRRPLPPGLWEEHKDTIRELYASLQLNEVMREMALSHDFHATLQQYKRQIGKWGLRKYVKTEDIDKIIADDGDSIGREGKSVSSRQIRRLQRRKELKSQEQSSSTSTPSDSPGGQRPQADSRIPSRTNQIMMPPALHREDRKSQDSSAIPSSDPRVNLTTADSTPSTTFEHFMKCLLLLRLVMSPLQRSHSRV